MSEKKQKVPKLRFPGFTGEWEQRKLCEVAEITMGQSPSSKNYTDNPEDFILVQGNADLKNGAVVPRLWTKEVTKTAEANSIILTVRAPVGEVAISGYDVVLGRGVAGIKGNDFLYYVLLCLKEFHYWEKLSSGSTFDSINSNDIKEILINMPDEKEQEVITSQLKNIDNLIILHLHKLENLKLKKKALLQKLFPKNGMQFPELRFPGFTDAWEQRKLGEVTSNIGDGLHGTPKYDDSGEYYFINGNNLNGYKVIIDNETKKVAENQLSNDDKKLNENSILMSINGTIGTLARYNGEKIMLGKSVSYINPSDIDRNYLYYYLQNDNVLKTFYKNLTGTTIKNLGLSVIKETFIMKTTIDEEFKIGKFFENVDNLITLHQHK